MLRTWLLLLCVYVCTIICAFPKEPQKSCRKPNGVLQIHRGGTHFFQMGEKFKVRIKGVLHTEVTQGSYSNVNLNIGIFSLPRMRYDACSFLTAYGINCPIYKGMTERRVDIDYKYNIPSGDITGTMDLYTHDGKFIACLRIETV